MPEYMSDQDHNGVEINPLGNRGETIVKYQDVWSYNSQLVLKMKDFIISIQRMAHPFTYGAEIVHQCYIGGIK